MSMVDPTVPVAAQALPPEARQAAYRQLLEQAGGRNDRGDSSQMMADILNRVDMDRSNGVAGMWANRYNQLGAGGTAMTDAVGAATAATRAKWATPPSTGGKRRGGGGSKPAPRVTNLNLQTPSWMQLYAQRLLQTPTYGSGGAATRMHYR